MFDICKCTIFNLDKLCNSLKKYYLLGPMLLPHLSFGLSGKVQQMVWIYQGEFPVSNTHWILYWIWRFYAWIPKITFVDKRNGDPGCFLDASRIACFHEPIIFSVRANCDGGVYLPDLQVPFSIHCRYPLDLNTLFHTCQVQKNLRDTWVLLGVLRKSKILWQSCLFCLDIFLWLFLMFHFWTSVLVFDFFPKTLQSKLSVSSCWAAWLWFLDNY